MAKVARRLLLHSAGKVALGSGGGPAYGPPETHHFHPDDHPEVTCCDGYAVRIAPAKPWANVHDGPGTDGVSNATLGRIRLWAWEKAGDWAEIYRLLYLFDTSSIPSGSKITAATLHLFVVEKSNSLSITPAVNIFTSWPTTNTDIIAADYQKLDNTPLCIPILYDDLLVPDFNDFPFIEAGLSAIIPAGITKLAVRESNYEAPDIPPPWGQFKRLDIDFAQAESEEARWADLEVTYEPPL